MPKLFQKLNITMTNLAYTIGNLLLPVCLKETQSARELWKKPVEPVLSPRALAIKDSILYFVKQKWSKEGVEAMRNFAAQLVESDDLRKEILSIKLLHELRTPHPVYNPFTVIVFENDYSEHKFTRDVPYIVTHGKHKYVLYRDSDIPLNIYNKDATNPDETRVATDEEVEACVHSLSAKQLRRIMTDELFAPIIECLYDDPTELVQVDESDPSSDTDQQLDIPLP